MHQKKINEEATQMLRAFGESLVPMIDYCEPWVAELDDSVCEIMLPLTRKTKNHLDSMYFGALSVGADCASGLLAMYHVQKSGENLSLVFKSVQGEFLKRPEGDVLFRCKEGDAVKALVKKCIETGERHHIPLTVEASVPSLGPELVANFVMTLSLKHRPM